MPIVPPEGHSREGWIVDVFWPKDEETYRGIIKRYNEELGGYFVKYDDFESQWHFPEENHKFTFIKKADPIKQPQPFEKIESDKHFLGDICARLEEKGMDPTGVFGNVIQRMQTKSNEDDDEDEDESGASDSEYDDSDYDEEESSEEETESESEEDSDDEPRRPKMILLKWVHQDTIQLSESKKSVSFEQLTEFVKENFGERLEITYKDDEGDIISINNTSQLKIAFSSFNPKKQKSFRLLLREKPPSPRSMSQLPIPIPKIPLPKTSSQMARPRVTIAATPKDSSPTSSSTSPSYQEVNKMNISLSQMSFDGTMSSNTDNNNTYRPSTTSSFITQQMRSTVHSQSSALLSARTRSRLPVQHWKKGDLIGAGSYGKVFSALDLRTGQWIAVKQVKIPTASENTKEVIALEQEIDLLQALNHENIIGYKGTQRKGNRLNIFLEYASGGSIAHSIAKFGPFSEAVIRRYCYQILCGLDYLHANDIVHRDIKGSNILVDHGVAKLADFGCSKRIVSSATQKLHTNIGTPQYMAPEMIKRADEETTEVGYDRKADIWSVGVVIIEMATGSPPWPQAPHAIYKLCMTEDIPKFPEELSDDAHDFLAQCFRRDPMHRPEANELLLHPFLEAPSEPESHMFKRTVDLRDEGGDYKEDNEQEYGYEQEDEFNSHFENDDDTLTG
eukprot:TRINITY_DN704473_c0_g1_i1.p1 TRINITY_DN704473_c0_g1~~TRINITY_DN704473_c0_g1_i1.p1  ORF type:complete len:676 (+),score=228.14 TRINITY_DN704473_c0_g1_i1:108-2135(+)